MFLSIISTRLIIKSRRIRFEIDCYQGGQYNLCGFGRFAKLRGLILCETKSISINKADIEQIPIQKFLKNQLRITCLHTLNNILFVVILYRRNVYRTIKTVPPTLECYIKNTRRLFENKIRKCHKCFVDKIVRNPYCSCENLVFRSLQSGYA